MKTAETFASIYYMIVSVCLRGAEMAEELNRRTGQRIRALPGGASFRVDLSDGILPTPGCRRVYPHVAAAEAAWCLLGHNHVDWLRTHTMVWDQFADARDCAECDGNRKVWDTNAATLDKNCPNCRGTGKTYWLEQAYGWRWRAKFGIDQLETGLDRLRADHSDRRVWISSWNPGEDIVPQDQKTVPCPVGFTLSVMAGKLNSSLMIRSSDLYMGLPYDVMRHCLVMAACAASLGVKPGIARFTLAHPHIYESNWHDASQMLAQKLVTPKLELPTTPDNVIMADPDEYVYGIRAAASKLEWPTFRGSSEVVA